MSVTVSVKAFLDAWVESTSNVSTFLGATSKEILNGAIPVAEQAAAIADAIAADLRATATAALDAKEKLICNFGEGPASDFYMNLAYEAEKRAASLADLGNEAFIKSILADSKVALTTAGVYAGNIADAAKVLNGALDYCDNGDYNKLGAALSDVGGGIDIMSVSRN